MSVVAAAADGYRTSATSSIDRAIRLSTAAAVLAVAGVAAYVSYWHAYAVVRAHGESGITARLKPVTIDGLVYASSMVVLYVAWHRVPVPSLARWLLGLGIAATLTANMAPGLVPRPGRGGGRGLAGSQSRRLVRTPGLAHPHLRDGRAQAAGRTPRRRRGPARAATTAATGAASPRQGKRGTPDRNGTRGIRSPGRRPSPPAGGVTRRYLSQARSMTPRWPRTG
jgi:Protein of unknown function (DUF2637)